jgi:hypothetical protein
MLDKIKSIENTNKQMTKNIKIINNNISIRFNRENTKKVHNTKIKNSV